MSVMQGFAIFSSSGEICQDEDVRSLPPDTTVFASIKGSNKRIAPIRVSAIVMRRTCQIHEALSFVYHTRLVLRQEKISFQPHPKTLTMAGELEYWAAQVRRSLVLPAATSHNLPLQPEVAHAKHRVY